MATVRVYAPSEREAGSPGQRQQAFDQGGGQVGAGLQALGQGLNQYAQAKDAFNARLDEAAAAELDAGFANAVRGIEREFTASQGKNAVDIAEQTQKAWNETAASYLSQARNPRQSQMLNAVLNRRRERWAGQYDRHLSNEGLSWRKSALESRIATMAVDATDLPVGSEERAEAYIDLGGALDEFVALTGGDRETRKLLGIQTFSGIHENTIGALLDGGDPLEAKRYLDEHADQILPATRNVLSNKVREAELDFVAYEAVRESFVVDADEEVEVDVGGDKQTLRLTQPVNARIGSRFGPRRSPGGVGSSNHKGVDYPVPANTPVEATLPGVVRVKSDPDGYGNYVVVEHGNGLETRYAHLNAVNVRDGQRVEQGDVIALSGGARGAPGAGNSQGAHLHYEVRRNGQAVDPAGLTGEVAVAPGRGRGRAPAQPTTEQDVLTWAEAETRRRGGDWRMQRALERAGVAEINRKRSARADAEGEALRAVEDYLPGGRSEVTDISAIPAPLVNALSPGQRRSVVNALEAEAKAKAGADGVDKVQAAVTFADLADEAATNPDVFMARGDFIAEYGAGLITREQFNSLRTLRRNLSTGGGEAADQIKNLNGVINAYARTAKITTGAGASVEDAERLSNFRSSLLQSIDGYRQRRGEWPDQNTIIGMMRVLVAQAENDGRRGRLFETGGQIRVSRGERAVILRELRNPGDGAEPILNPTEDDIQAAARHRRLLGLSG